MTTEDLHGVITAAVGVAVGVHVLITAYALIRRAANNV